jgi:hypothetical protein
MQPAAKMQPIEVRVRMEPDGAFTPVYFVWERRTYQVAEISGRWQAEDGQHILVIIPEYRGAFELLYKPEEGHWYVAKGHDQARATTVQRKKSEKKP